MCILSSIPNASIRVKLTRSTWLNNNIPTCHGASVRSLESRWNEIGKGTVITLDNAKYRYWNGYNMQAVTYMKWNRDGELIEYGNDANKIEGYMLDQNVLEQYTGLKDKTGREIYEGDILETTSVVLGKQVTAHLLVEWRPEYAGFYCGETALFACLSDFDRGVMLPQTFPEVIGNVHENPELLNGDDHDEVSQ